MKVFLIAVSLLFSVIVNAEEDLNGYCEVEMINNMECGREFGADLREEFTKSMVV